MGRARRDYHPLYVHLSGKVIDRIERLATATKRTASDVVDEAIRRFLRHSRDGERGVHVPPVDGELHKCRYNVEPDTDTRLRKAKERTGLRLQDVTRAAIEGHLELRKG